jgi:chorismate mutase
MMAAPNLMTRGNRPVPSMKNAFNTLMTPRIACALLLAVTADQVALSKWDSGQPVYDPAREAKVIANASSQATAYGLAAADVSDVFTDQIEANKEVQYALLNDWRRTGAAPTAQRQSLPEVIRPKLDELQKSILQALREAATARGQADCPVQVANETGRVAQEKSLDSLHRIALDRATARLCSTR